MSEIPADLRYTKSHEWVREDASGEWTVGITDHAQALLGDLVFVETPAVGTQVSAGEACATVESVKAASDIYAPLSGEVVAVNEALADAPEQVNQAPYADGWLFRIRATSGADDLLDAAAYRAEIDE